MVTQLFNPNSLQVCSSYDGGRSQGGLVGLCSHSREARSCGTVCTEEQHLLPAGKDLVKEDSGSDREVPQTSDSERTTKVRRGQRRSCEGH